MADQESPTTPPPGGKLFGWFLAGVSFLLLFLFFQMLKPFLIALFWAALLAFLLHPIHRWLSSRLKNRGWLSAALLTAGTAFAILVPLLIVGTILGIEARQAYEILKVKIEKFDMDAALREANTILPGDLLKDVREWMQSDNESVQQHVLGWMKTLLLHIRRGLENMILIMINFGVMLFALFFLLRDGAVLFKGLYDLLPMPPEQKTRIFRQLQDALHATILGMVATATVQGLLAGLFFWILGISFPVLGGVLTFIFAFVPMVGSAAVWMPVASYLILTGSYFDGIALLVLGALIVSQVDNVLRPIIIGHRTRLPTLFVFLTILGGLKVFGFSGVLIGPALLALMVGVLEVYMHEFHPGPGQAVSR